MKVQNLLYPFLCGQTLKCLKEAKQGHKYNGKHSVVVMDKKRKCKWAYCVSYRPVVEDCEAHIYIKQGRHPVLDFFLPENQQYVPNDTDMNVS